MEQIYYGKRLTYLREEKNLKQYEVSKILDLKRKVYGNYEREETIISIKHLNTLINYYNVSMDYIFEFTNEKKYTRLRKETNLELIRIRLQELRKEHNLSQKQLAFELNVSASTISEYERKAKVISTLILYAICKKYHISADYLLGKTDNPKYLK